MFGEVDCGTAAIRANPDRFQPIPATQGVVHGPSPQAEFL